MTAVDLTAMVARGAAAERTTLLGDPSLVRLYVFEDAGADGTSNFSPLDLGTAEAGLVPDGVWQKIEAGREPETGAFTPETILIFHIDGMTATLLAPLSHYAIAVLDADTGLWTGDVTLATPDGGVAVRPDERAGRWIGSRRVAVGWAATATSGVFPYTFDFALA